jgi:DNA-directed RNA polymerase subunit RPC12/RpoP
MTELKQEKFPCEQCGANLVFVPGAHLIQCEYCRHEQKIQVLETNEPILEYDFEEALRTSHHGESKSLSPDGKEIQCSGCGAVSLVTEQSTRCPFCGSPVVVDLKDSVDRIIPESLLPFSIDKKTAQTSFLDWLKSRWFAPGDLSKRANRDGMDGIYLPFWTYDSDTSTSYRGERGEHYYETESYKTADGKRQTRQVQKTRWYKVSGRVSVSFDDILVCASESLPQNLVDGLEPWELDQLVSYNPKFLSGFTTERYKIDLKNGFGTAKDKMDPEIERTIYSDIGGDVQRVHSKTVSYSNIKYKHILLPLWVSSFRYKDKIYRVIVNARNGQVSGERPYSWIKITLAVLCGLAVIGLGYYYLNI